MLMNWREATIQQLHIICSPHEEAPMSLKLEAAAEIQRRRTKTYTRLQNQEKKTYPR